MKDGEAPWWEGSEFRLEVARFAGQVETMRLLGERRRSRRWWQFWRR